MNPEYRSDQVVGERTEKEAVGLMSMLKARLVNGTLPLLTSDSLAHYVQAILQVFEKWF